MKKGKNLAGFLFIFPALFVLLCIVLYPLLHTLWLSLQNKVLIAPNQDEFVGFNQYIEVFQSADLLHALWITIIFTLTSVAMKLVLGMIGALLLQVKSKATKIYWSIFMIPWLIPSVVAALIWRWILHDQYGILNQVLLNFNLIDTKVAWLSDSILALISVILVDVWVGLPFMIIVCLAGLNTIPKEWYEAAMVDGASFLQRFRYITLPGMKPILLVIGILSLIGTFNSFNIIYTLTGGGPVNATTTLVIHIYQMAFTNYDFGMASTLSALTLLIIFILISLYRKALDKEGDLL
ncbi:carbohydrate ABC transporter permease [Bacillus suaedae]|uniref:Sugar ABC transporter permease n=1 Tax=Halalkalibacter suaedae TaxID=2822140 RepID=A0A941AT60_9BACI|nr:sugar ABC transporter permease [Bacillus suaedae]MBP3950969.1 sugar ABC transporter permease [Bacillus suaedae]